MAWWLTRTTITIQSSSICGTKSAPMSKAATVGRDSKPLIHLGKEQIRNLTTLWTSIIYSKKSLLRMSLRSWGPLVSRKMKVQTLEMHLNKYIIADFLVIIINPLIRIKAILLMGKSRSPMINTDMVNKHPCLVIGMGALTEEEKGLLIERLPMEGSNRHHQLLKGKATKWILLWNCKSLKSKVVSLVLIIISIETQQLRPRMEKDLIWWRNFINQALEHHLRTNSNLITCMTI